jgi:hypothetical protein
MGCMEAAAYLALDPSPGSWRQHAADGGGGSGGCTSRLLHAGVLGGGSGVAAAGGGQGAAEAGGDEEVPTPFLALEKAAGQVLSSCIDALSEAQLLAVAAAAGRSLAAFHAAPLPPAAACQPQPAAGLGSCACGGSGGNCQEPARHEKIVAGHRAAVQYSTAWIARDGILYSSTLGTLQLQREEAAQQLRASHQAELAQRQRLALRSLFPGAAAVLLGPTGTPSALPSRPAEAQLRQEAADSSSAAAADAVAPAAAAPPGQPACLRCAAWQPFAAFLRRQRGGAAAMHRGEGSLPPHLLDQLDAFLPADPAELLGCACLLRSGAGSSQAVHGGTGQLEEGDSVAANGAPADGNGCCSGSLPTWVHGDLTVGNLLVQGLSQHSEHSHPEQQQAQQPPPGPGEVQGAAAARSAAGGPPEVCVSLIDFADGGQGDPLWDFVVLLLRTLRCHRGAGRAALAAYAAAAAPPRWPQRPPGVSLAYVAMCYTLLHELAPLHDLIKRQPELWEARTLEEVAAAAWGWLDEAAACWQQPH